MSVEDIALHIRTGKEYLEAVDVSSTPEEEGVFSLGPTTELLRDAAARLVELSARLEGEGNRVTGQRKQATLGDSYLYDAIQGSQDNHGLEAADNSNALCDVLLDRKEELRLMRKAAARLGAGILALLEDCVPQYEDHFAKAGALREQAAEHRDRSIQAADAYLANVTGSAEQG
jgi:hypothetical protein